MYLIVLVGLLGFGSFAFSVYSETQENPIESAPADPETSNLVGQTEKSAAVETTLAADELYTFAGTYYSLKDGQRSVLMFNNKASLPLVVNPTFFSMSGEWLDLPPLIIPAADYQEFDLRDLLANAGQQFQEGSVQVTHQGKRQQLGVQVKILKGEKKLIFDEQFIELARRIVSSRLENAWWLPSPLAKTRLIVSNTTDSPVTATIKVDGTAPQQQQAVTIELNPRQTRELDILRDLVGQQQGGILHKEGGISIAHSAAPGAILARMLVSEENTGFSGFFNFTDPQGARSSRWHGSGYRIGKIGNEELIPIVVARNIGNEPSVVSGRLSYTNDAGEVIFANVPAVQLAANEVRSIDVARAVKQGSVPANITDTGFEFEYSTLSGSVVMAALSVSKSGNHVFQVPLFSPGRAGTSAGGYPWKAEGDYSTMLYIKNETDQPQKYTAVLLYEGGGYTLGIKDIKPHQLVAVDFRALRDNQTPDVNGNIIPLNIERGQIAWSGRNTPNGTLSGRSHQSSISEGVSSTYDCRNYCGNSYYSGYITYDLPLAFIEDVSNFTAYQQDTNAYGSLLTPYPVGANFQSSNTVVADFYNAGEAKAFTEGITYFHATWFAEVFFTQSGSYECNYQMVLAIAEQFIEIKPLVKIQGPQSALDGDTVTFSATVENTSQYGAPTNYQWSFEPDSGANNPQMNFTAPTSVTTGAKAHWFARPDSACDTHPNSTYEIKVKVTFQNGKQRTGETKFTVKVLVREWIGKVPEPNTEGEPEIKYDTINGLWRVVGPGTLKRVPNEPDMSRVPKTTQFYNKILKHEEVHVKQFATGMLSNLYQIDNLMRHLYPLTDPNEQPLRQKIHETIQAWRKSEGVILEHRLENEGGEREAYEVSDQIAPKYLFHNCGRFK